MARVGVGRAFPAQIPERVLRLFGGMNLLTQQMQGCGVDYGAWLGPPMSVHICFISTKPSERNNRNLRKITYLEKGLRRVHLTVSFLKKKKKTKLLFIYLFLFLAVLGIRCCMWVSLVAVYGLLIPVASPVAWREL